MKKMFNVILGSVANVFVSIPLWFLNLLDVWVLK